LAVESGKNFRRFYKKNVSLTGESILRTLMRFAVPIFLSLLMQALYGGIDLLVAGLYRGLFGIASYCPADESYIRIDAVSDWSWNTCFK